LLNEKYGEEAIKAGFKDGCEYYINREIQQQKQTPLKSLIEPFVKQINNIEYLIKEEDEKLYEREFVARNDIVLNKFAEQIVGVNSENPKHIVIFYGAGHMHYFEGELCQKYGLQFKSEEWISAVTYNSEE
jgi:hypothetical protein